MRMKKKNTSILILGLFFGSLILSAIPVYAEEEKYTTADADSYINENYPTSNYGYAQFLHVMTSDYISEAEAYFHFDFTDKPDNSIKAEIEIDLYTTPIPFHVTVYLITGVWDEYTLTWNNKPLLGELIASLTISTCDISFDVSDFIKGDGISICLKTTSSTQIGMLTAYSREWTYSPPQLIWTYEEEKINGYIILLVILGTIGVVFIIYRKQITHTRTI